MIVETTQGPAEAEPTRMEELGVDHIVLGLADPAGSPRTVYRVTAPLGDYQSPQEERETLTRWERFASDALAVFEGKQRGILVEHVPTNTPGMFTYERTPVLDRVTRWHLPV